MKKKRAEGTEGAGEREGLAAADLSALYERLRSQILHGSEGELMAGLGVLLHQGMREWMSSCRQCLQSVAGSGDSGAARTHIPSPMAAQIVSLMASMVLNHRRKEQS